MKSYTDLEQSKKLSEILPLESADMYYAGHQSIINPKEWEYGDTPKIRGKYISFNDKRIFYPCWSLSALMDVLDRGALFKTPQGWACQSYIDLKAITSDHHNNPIDACYEMIVKFNEMNLS